MWHRVSPACPCAGGCAHWDNQQAILRLRGCLASPGLSREASSDAGQLWKAAVTSSVSVLKSISIAKSYL